MSSSSGNSTLVDAFSFPPSLTFPVSSALFFFFFFFLGNERLGSGLLVQLKKKRGKEERNNELGLYGERKWQEASGMDFHAVPDFVIFRTEYLHFLGANLHIIFFNLTYYLKFFEIPIFHCCYIKIHLTFVC